MTCGERSAIIGVSAVLGLLLLGIALFVRKQQLELRENINYKLYLNEKRFYRQQQKGLLPPDSGETDTGEQLSVLEQQQQMGASSSTLLPTADTNSNILRYTDDDGIGHDDDDAAEQYQQQHTSSIHRAQRSRPNSLILSPTSAALNNSGTTTNTTTTGNRPPSYSFRHQFQRQHYQQELERKHRQLKQEPNTKLTSFY